MSAPETAAAPPADLADGGEPLVDRVWRQVRDGLDRARLLPADDKRRRDLAKRLDKPMDRNGWRMFAAGCAHTIEHGKASQRRNAEIQLVETVARWTADVAELMPERMADLRAIVDHGLSHPAPLPQKDGDRHGLWSVRVSGNWRIVFRFAEGVAVDVDLIDYH